MSRVAEIRAAGFIMVRLIGEVQYLLLQCRKNSKNWTPPKGIIKAIAPAIYLTKCINYFNKEPLYYDQL